MTAIRLVGKRDGMPFCYNLGYLIFTSASTDIYTPLAKTNNFHIYAQTIFMSMNANQEYMILRTVASTRE